MKKLPALFQTPASSGSSSTWTGRGGASGGGMAELASKLDQITGTFAGGIANLTNLTSQSLEIQAEISDDIEDMADNVGASTKLTDKLLKTALNTEKLTRDTYKLHKQHYDWLKRKSVKDDLAAEEAMLERRRIAGSMMGPGGPGGPGGGPGGGSGGGSGGKGGLESWAAGALGAAGAWAWGKMRGKAPSMPPPATQVGTKPTPTVPTADKAVPQKSPERMTPQQKAEYDKLRKQNIPAQTAKKIAQESVKPTASQAAKAGAQRIGARALGMANPALAVAGAGMLGWEVGTAINERVLDEGQKDWVGEKVFGAMSYVPGTEAWEMQKSKDPNIMHKAGAFAGGFASKLTSNVSRWMGNAPSISGDDDIKALIKKHEGYSNRPYQDSLGKWTVGYGHLIGDGSKLPPDWNRTFTREEMDKLFESDYYHHKKAAEKIPGFDKLNRQGQAALIDLTFNMGPNWHKKFPNTAAAIARGDMESAAQGLEQSLWYQQVKSRAPAVVALMRAGADGGPSVNPLPSASVATAVKPLSAPPSMMAASPQQPTSVPRVDTVIAASRAAAQTGATKAPVVINNITNVAAPQNGGGSGDSRGLGSPYANREVLDQRTSFVAGVSALG